MGSSRATVLPPILSPQRLLGCRCWAACFPSVLCFSTVTLRSTLSHGSPSGRLCGDKGQRRRSNIWRLQGQRRRASKTPQRYEVLEDYPFRLQVDNPEDISRAMMRCQLRASNLSAFCGRHRYRSQKDAFLEVLGSSKEDLQRVEQALDQEDLLFRPLLDTLGVQVPSDTTATQVCETNFSRDDVLGQKAKDLRDSATPATPEDVESLRRIKPKTLEVVKKAVNAVRAAEGVQRVKAMIVLEEKDNKQAQESTKAAAVRVAKEQQLTEASAKLVEAKVEKTWVMDRGTNLEAAVLQSLRKRCPIGYLPRRDLQTAEIYFGQFASATVSMMPDLVYVKEVPRPPSPDLINLPASSGGVHTVFEVKNRQRRFMEPSYDLDQLCMYVLGCNASEGGVLVQKCQARVREARIMTREEALQRFVHDILPCLEQAMVRYGHAVRSPMAPENFAIWRDLRVIARTDREESGG